MAAKHKWRRVTLANRGTAESAEAKDPSAKKLSRFQYQSLLMPRCWPTSPP